MGQVPPFNLAKEFRELSERVKSVDLHPTKPWILAGLYSGTVCIWNYQTQLRSPGFACISSGMGQGPSFNIAQEFRELSERVKSVDLHPTKPWILAGLYSGTVCIWNYQTQTKEKSFKVTESPVRSAKFIARKHWIVTGSDDKSIRVYNYETRELVKEFEAHSDYIRSVLVHPTLSRLLSSSDDMLIKMWDWEKGWKCTRTFQGHSHYVTQVVFNPEDTSIFASASLDATVKIWNLSSPAPVATLNGHSKGLKCLDFSMMGDKLRLISGSDDFTVKEWDYETKRCVGTLEGHTQNVTSCCVHPQLHMIITTSEDNTIRLWGPENRPLLTLDYGLQRVWAVGGKQGSCQFAFGCDNGITMLKVSMDVHSEASD